MNNTEQNDGLRKCLYMQPFWRYSYPALAYLIAGLIWELSKDFMMLVLISIFIAAPFAYYFMEQWLSDFAYRIDIQWWFFALSGFTALVIAFCTISYHAIRAALMNPVKSLRSE